MMPERRDWKMSPDPLPHSMRIDRPGVSQLRRRSAFFTKGGYSQKDVERLILSMPFKRYEDMHIMHHSKNLGTLQFYKVLARQLTDDDYTAIRQSCHAALSKCFGTAEAR